ncbi:MAG: hypothetical protein RBR05_03535 [Candidatus Methanomethylophilaceae archaeon]|nr:hypothetical protein [Candidatus Methanomethylophilaceae archaeon]MDY0224456.1 hypothetical protein [Candidatus Methanomethylophilaceae archaeon]
MNIKEIVKLPNGTVAFVALRFIIGFLLIWAFLDKTFGLGFATKAGAGFISGGSPSTGFLKYNDGIFASFFNALAGSTVVDVLLLLAFLCIGTGLILGIAKKLTCIAGCLLFLLMYLASLPLANNPIIDEHIVYIVVLIGIYLSNAGIYLGLGNKWNELCLVKRFPILQ